MFKNLILLLLFTSCNDFNTVEETTMCQQYKTVFRCRGTIGTVAICDTKEECTRICLEKFK